jgi:hypothetical protein
VIKKIQYKVGPHVLEVTGDDSQWTAAVDGVRIDRRFTSSSDAWTAGVTEADRLDRFEASALSPGAGGGAGQAT